jgi:hypothetical protein
MRNVNPEITKDFFPMDDEGVVGEKIPDPIGNIQKLRKCLADVWDRRENKLWVLRVKRELKNGTRKDPLTLRAFERREQTSRLIRSHVNSIANILKTRIRTWLWKDNRKWK